ncbi:MAG: TlpA disulfide reductase family protein [Chitinophagales bacterium]
MKKQFLLLLTITGAFLSCQSTSKEGMTVKGQLTNVPKETKVFLEELTYISRNGIDTTVLDAKGKFELEVNVKSQGLYQLRIGEQRAIFLVLDEKTGTVEVTADTAEFSNFTYKVKGSPASDQLRDFISHTKKYGEAFGNAMNEYNLNVDGETEDSIRKIYEHNVMKADSDFRSYTAKYIDTVKNPIVAVFAATNLDYKNDAATINKLADRMSKEHGELPFVKDYLKVLNDQKSQMQGQNDAPMFEQGTVVPDIALQDFNGNTLKLSSLRGNVVLLDFWASWCGPCRKENPNVVKAYETYKDKGFTIYSVSLDTDKNKWVAGIKKDQLMWPNHVSDLKGWQSSVCETYGIHAIPQSFLLDKDGKVIATNLRGEQLLSTLQSVFQ